MKPNTFGMKRKKSNKPMIFYPINSVKTLIFFNKLWLGTFERSRAFRWKTICRNSFLFSIEVALAPFLSTNSIYS